MSFSNKSYGENNKSYAVQHKNLLIRMASEKNEDFLSFYNNQLHKINTYLFDMFVVCRRYIDYAFEQADGSKILKG